MQPALNDTLFEAHYPMDKAMINSTRLWDHLMELGKIGMAEGGGTTRFAFTDGDMQAQALVRRYMLDAGLAVREDAVGNLFGRLEGKKTASPIVMTGSHLDTVVSGGMFDGVLGVLAGIEVLHTMNENGLVPNAPIEVCAFKDEEGARFSFSMSGSRAISGILTEEDLQHKDKDGKTMFEVMRERGCHPEKFKDAAWEKGRIKAFVELHIEQGKVLESRNLAVGVVTGIYSSLWMRLKITGSPDHAGGAPMHLRKDALVAASKVILYVNEYAAKTGSGVGTVGQISVSPSMINTVPGEATFTVDLRDINPQTAENMERDVLAYVEKVCADSGLTLAPIEIINKLPPTLCDEGLMQVVENAFAKQKQPVFRLPSGAWHDAMRMARIAPIAMIFVRCKNGVSHRPDEWASQEDCEIAANVLLQTLMDAAE